MCVFNHLNIWHGYCCTPGQGIRVINANTAQAAKEKEMDPVGYVIHTVVLLLAFASIAIWVFGK